MAKKPEQCITLKWGTLKGWDVAEDNKEAMKLLERYHEIGSSMSAAMQRDTEEQKKILCDLVSLPGMKVYLDWDAKYITPKKAVKYIMEYGKND